MIEFSDFIQQSGSWIIDQKFFYDVSFMFSRRTSWALTLNRFTEAQRQVIAEGREVLDLSISNPTRAGITYDAGAVLSSLKNSAAMDYDPQPKGLRSAREAVAAYYRECRDAINYVSTAQQDVDPESIVLTTSTSEGYSHVLRLLCNPGEEMLVPKPSYPLFEFLADLQDVKLVSYPLIYDHGWQMDFASLAKAVTQSTRAVVIVHPNNPTGSYVNAAERSSLNAFCSEHGLALIVDEVFLDYPQDGTPRPTFAANQDVLTFTLSGVSKISGLPQMKLAWIVASGPGAQVNPAMARLEIIADTYLSMSAPIQLAAPVLLEQRKSIQPLLRKRVHTNLDQLDRVLAKQKTCQRLQVEGGWYAVLRVPVTQTDEELAIELLRQRSVLVHPGHFYDFEGDGYLILSLITPTGHFQNGVERMLELLNSG